MAKGLLQWLGFGSTIQVGGTAEEAARIDPPPAGGTLVSEAYLTYLVGQGKLTLTQKGQVISGTLTPESLVALGTITSNEYAALTGQPYQGAGASVQAVAWSPTLVAADGQYVTFNGTLYQAIGAPPAGTIPPVELAAPGVAAMGSRYRLVCRGRSEPLAWDANTQYYRDQVVTYAGGRYKAETAVPTKGTAPSSNGGEWSAEFQGMTAGEAAQLTAQTCSGTATANLSTLGTNVSSISIVQQRTNDMIRVRRFDMTMTTGGTAVATQTNCFTVTFPLPLTAGKTPAIRIIPQNSHGARGCFVGVPFFNGTNQCTGFYLYNGQATVAADYAAFRVEVTEDLGQ